MPIPGIIASMPRAAGAVDPGSSKTFTITGSSDGVLTNYPMRVIAHYDSGVDGGLDVYLGGESKPNWEGIQFRDEGGALLDFWREKPTSPAVAGKGSTATFWVRMPTIPASPATTTATINYGISAVGDESEGPSTFAGHYFEDFSVGGFGNTPFGTDSGQSSAFCPLLRRFYIFGAEEGGGFLIPIIQWVDIDTWETGFSNPASNIPVLNGAVVWHAQDELFYIYGGRNSSQTPIATIYSYDPFTTTLTLLSEQLTQVGFNANAVYYDDGVNPKVYIFGGYRGSNVFNDTIWVHDTDAGTPLYVAGATLRTGCNSIGIAIGNDNHIYLCGGAYYSGSILSLDTVDKFNPATESVDPVPVTTLTTRRDSIAVAPNADGSALYLFGGYDYNTATYFDIISRLDVSTGLETELGEAIPRPDDDAAAFYDSVNGRIFAAPFLAAGAPENSDEQKTLVLQFNPATELMDTVPVVGLFDIPGWTNESNGTNGEARFVGNTLRFRDLNVSVYGWASSDPGSITVNGKEIFEFGCSRPTAPVDTNVQVYARNSGEDAVAGLTTRNSSAGVTQGINTYGGTDSAAFVAPVPVGDVYVMGLVHDPVQGTVWGEVNRGARSASNSYANAGPMNNWRINTSTGGDKGWQCFHWILARPWTENEPTLTF